VIAGIEEEQCSMAVRFDDRTVTFDATDLDNLVATL
jgi:hypothetical protein